MSLYSGISFIRGSTVISMPYKCSDIVTCLPVVYKYANDEFPGSQS